MCKSAINANAKPKVIEKEQTKEIENELIKPQEIADCYEEESKFSLKRINAKYPKNVAAIIEGSILRNSRAGKWEEIAGNEEVKKQLIECVVTPLKQRARTAATGILIYGPPGNGKTILARALASHFGPTLIFINISSKAINSKETVSAIFETATISQPCIIFIDEIEKVLKVKKGYIEIRQEQLERMDAIERNYKGRIIVVGTTSNPFEIDKEALNKFQKKIYVPLPDFIQRSKYIHKNLDKFNDEQVKQLTEKTELFSYDDLNDLCKEIKNKMKELEFDKLIENALKKTTATATDKVTEIFHEWNKIMFKSESHIS